MAFIDIAKKRYSSRKYLDKPVDRELLLQVLEAGRVAPSAKNKQPWHFVVITQEAQLKKIRECYERNWLQTAKCIIVVCGDHREAWRRADGKIHTDIDVAITVDHMTLAQTSRIAGLSVSGIRKRVREFKARVKDAKEFQNGI